MVSEKELKEYKEIIQKIIDKHLPEEKRISVEEYTEEDIRYISRILLEKDKSKREKIRDEFSKRKEEAEKDFLMYNEEIINQKNKYDTIFNTIDEINSLNLDINTELSIEKQF